MSRLRLFSVLTLAIITFTVTSAYLMPATKEHLDSLNNQLNDEQMSREEKIRTLLDLQRHSKERNLKLDASFAEHHVQPSDPVKPTIIAEPEIPTWMVFTMMFGVLTIATVVSLLLLAFIRYREVTVEFFKNHFAGAGEFEPI